MSDILISCEKRSHCSKRHTESPLKEARINLG